MVSRDVCSCLRSITPKPSSQMSVRGFRRGGASLTKSTKILNIRHQSTQATSPIAPESSYDTSPTKEGKKFSAMQLRYRTSAGIILCRSPIITRELSEFEVAFYAYQRHLKSRLSSPFPTDFYFQKGSLASKRWQAGEDARQQANNLSPSTPTLASDSSSEMTGQERELQDEEDVAASVAVSRTTSADLKNDTKSLDRKLDRTLYLLLKKPRSKHAWQFPQGPTGTNEVLHDSCSRVLKSLAGGDMNTWTVGRVPVGHLIYRYESQTLGYLGNKVFFMKARIFAGQCKLPKEAGVDDFGWFTKEEIEERVDEEYWKAVDAMLPTQ